jgi:Mg/Co/Ni transporter MgtE
MNKIVSEHARSLTYRPDERMALLRSMTIPEQSAAFVELSPYVQQSILEQMKVHEVIDLLDHMDI